MSTPDPFDGDDPFDLPLFDPDTGEVLDDEPPPVPPAPPPEQGGALVEAMLNAVPLADPGTFARDLGQALRYRVTAYAERLAAQRPAGRLTQAAVQHEVIGLTDAHDALRGIARAFGDAADLARDCLREVTLEVRGDRVEREGGSTSVRVGGAGGDVRVTVTQPTATTVDDAAVVDVIRGVSLNAVFAEGNDGGPHSAVRTAQFASDAVDAALARYRSLTSPPKWKITALDVWRRALETAGDPAAVKLAAAYGRAPHGAPRTTVEHVPREGDA